MLYLGFTMKLDTMEAFLGENPLLFKEGHVRAYSLDKGVWVLGIALTKISSRNIWSHDYTLTESLESIQKAKLDFDAVMKKQGVDLHNVQMDYMESESKIHE